MRYYLTVFHDMNKFLLLLLLFFQSVLNPPLPLSPTFPDCTSQYCGTAAVSSDAGKCLELGEEDEDCCALPFTASCAEGYTYVPAGVCFWGVAITSCCVPSDGSACELFGTDGNSNCVTEYCTKSAVQPSSNKCLENGRVDSDVSYSYDY